MTRHCSGAGFAVLGLLYALAAAADPSAEAKSHYDAGIAAKQAKDLPKATAELKQAIGLDDDYTDAHWALAWVYAAQGDKTDAAAQFSEVIRLAPDTDNGRAAKEALARLGVSPPATPTAPAATPAAAPAAKYDPVREIADCNRAIAATPDDAMTYCRRGTAYCYLHAFDLAIPDFNKAITLKADLPEAHYGRGRAFAEGRQDFDTAVTEFTAAIGMKPDYAEAYSSRGAAIARGTGDFDRAVADCAKAIQLKPNVANAWYCRGLCFAAKQDWDSAIADYSKAIALDPNFAEAFDRRGTACWEGKHDFHRGIADHTAAIKLRPNVAEFYTNRGTAYDETHDYDNAVTDLTKAIELEPKNAVAYNNRGAAYHRAREYERALSDFTEAVRLEPNLAIAYRNRAVTQLDGFHDVAAALADANLCREHGGKIEETLLKALERASGKAQ